MLKIVYKGAVYVYDCDKNLVEGTIVTFEGNRRVRLCTSEDIPIGFVCQGRDELFGVKTVGVALGQAEYVTDKFERSTYKLNDFIYCSDRGIITNEKIYKGNIIIGIVNNIPNADEIGFITCFARNIERN